MHFLEERSIKGRFIAVFLSSLLVFFLLGVESDGAHASGRGAAVKTKSKPSTVKRGRVTQRTDSRITRKEKVHESDSRSSARVHASMSQEDLARKYLYDDYKDMDDDELVERQPTLEAKVVDAQGEGSVTIQLSTKTSHQAIMDTVTGGNELLFRRINELLNQFPRGEDMGERTVEQVRELLEEQRAAETREIPAEKEPITQAQFSDLMKEALADAEKMRSMKDHARDQQLIGKVDNILKELGKAATLYESLEDRLKKIESMDMTAHIDPSDKAELRDILKRLGGEAANIQKQMASLKAGLKISVESTGEEEGVSYSGLTGSSRSHSSISKVTEGEATHIAVTDMDALEVNGWGGDEDPVSEAMRRYTRRVFKAAISYSRMMNVDDRWY